MLSLSEQDAPDAGRVLNAAETRQKAPLSVKVGVEQVVEIFREVSRTDFQFVYQRSCSRDVT